jgi:thymidylate synthase (FAD)
MDTLVRAHAEIVHGHETPDEVVKLLERIGRSCYASENKITPQSAEPFVHNIVQQAHEAVIEHCGVTVLFTCSRSVSHELVRHRLCSFMQRSQRYIDGSSGGKHPLQFIDPEFSSRTTGKRYTAADLVSSSGCGEDIVPSDVIEQYREYYSECVRAREHYDRMRTLGAPPEDAREGLPNGTVTEIFVTANLREWRHIFELRCSPRAHHLFRRVALELLAEFNKLFPSIFSDLAQKYNNVPPLP